MTETTNDNHQSAGTQEKGGEDMQMGTGKQGLKENPRTISGKFREASYVVLFIAAVFVVNAMETGSYRTPWPVAVITTLAGLGLLGYSWYLRSRAK